MLLVGETGTGKEVLARTLHERSPRRAHPLLAVFCTAWLPDLLPSELFGHPAPVFGAGERKPGLVERASGGTLVLDEIAMLEPSMQVFLVRVLQERTIKRIGDRRAHYADVRIVATTNQDLPRMCRKGQFRSDFLSAFTTVRVPPLRERGGEDIKLLALYFLELFASKHDRRVSGFTDAAMRALVMYPWPGNEQDLGHVVERAVILMGPGELITMDDLWGA